MSLGVFVPRSTNQRQSQRADTSQSATGATDNTIQKDVHLATDNVIERHARQRRRRATKNREFVRELDKGSAVSVIG